MGPGQSGGEMSKRVVVVVPTLNEAANIRACLISLRKGAPGTPIWVYDGGSRDGTPSIVKELSEICPDIHLLRNPRRVQAAAINLAAMRARKQGFEVLVRADAHALYPANFAAKLLSTMHKSGAASVVVPMISRGEGEWQKAAADLFNSRLGHGGAGHRGLGKSGYVRHGHHAAFDLAVFEQLGGYDVSFVANEDAEFDHRLHKAGHRIYQEAGAAITYLPRVSPYGLWRQMIRNGWYRARNLAIHRTPPKPRQILPLVLFAGNLTSALLAVQGYGEAILLPLAYAALVVAWAQIIPRRFAPVHALRIAGLAMLCHHGFAIGAAAFCLAQGWSGIRQRLFPRQRPCRV